MPSPDTAALMDAMKDFYRGMVTGALAGFVVGAISTYFVYGWWVARLLRRIASDTRQLLDRIAPRPK